MNIFGRSQNKGVALTTVVIILIMLALIGGYVISLGYNQKRMVSLSSGEKIRLYYNAQAGIVDANWRIRNNVGADFTNPVNTLAYTLNDGTIHADVSIGVPDAAGKRPINSIGKDS